MIIQTVQPISLLNELNTNKIVFARPDYKIYDEDGIDWNFKTCYQWIREQMIQRNILPYLNETEVFWAWAWSGDRDNKKVDLRTRRHHHNQDKVLLTIEKKPQEILLSDYDLWHYVLNYWVIYNSKSDGKKWDKICENELNNYYSHKPLKDLNLDKQITNSWQKIFEFKEVEDYFQSTLDEKNQKYLNIFNKKIRVQATFWNIKINEVKKIQIIK